MQPITIEDMATATQLPITFDREKLAQFCREHGIRSLRLFGSVLRDDFDAARSDVDVLAEFAPGVLAGTGLSYFRLGDELGAILGRRVDFCSQLDPALRERVDRESLQLYEQP